MSISASPPSDAVSSAPGPTPDPAVEAAPPGGRRLTAFLAIAYFGVWLAFFSPIILTVPLQIAALAPDDKTSALSIVLGGSAVFMLLAGPLAGRLSDRSRSRFGRRRPWLLGSMLIGLVGAVVEAFAADVPVFFVGFSLAGIGFAGAVAVLLSTLPEHIPASRRGRVSGLLGVGQAISVVVGVVLAGGLTQASVAVAFLVPAVIGLALTLLLCAVLPDRPHREGRPKLNGQELAQSFWIDPRTNPDFGWVWLSRFFLFMAFAGITNYQVFYLTDQLGLTSASAGTLIGLGTGAQVIATIVASLLAGRLSDRFGRRKVFVMASALVGVVALLLLAFATSVPIYVVAMALNGLANGTYYSVDLALVTDILPDRRIHDGRDLGVFGLANQIPNTLAPALAPAFLAISFGSVAAAGDNYTAFFLVSALFALISAVVITRVRGAR